MKSLIKNIWRQGGRDIIILLAIMIPFRSSIADWNHVPSGSMLPTIVEGDRILVNKLAYDLKLPLTKLHLAEWGDPKRGDIVVFYSPADGKRLVKRVVGLPGDEIAMHNNQLFINGAAVVYKRFADSSLMPDGENSIIVQEMLDGSPHPVMALPGEFAFRTFAPILLPKNKYFMLGDNRDNSADSRVFGLVDRRQIVGRSSMVVASFDRERFYLPRSNRWFKSLQ